MAIFSTETIETYFLKIGMYNIEVQKETSDKIKKKIGLEMSGKFFPKENIQRWNCERKLSKNENFGIEIEDENFIVSKSEYSALTLQTCLMLIQRQYPPFLHRSGL